VEKLLGALPVVAEFCRRLDLAGIVDRACPMRAEVARVTHGQVIEALVANRLTSPRPLLRVEDWAREWAVEEAFGIAADALNDDRIGRALDALAAELEQVIGSVGAHAIAALGVDVARLHWDMTSMSLYGVYDDAEAGFAQPRWGKPKTAGPISSRSRPALRSVAMVASGMASRLRRRRRRGRPGGGRDGGAQGPGWGAQAAAGGDSKLVSRGNIVAMNTAQVRFIAPAGKPYLPPPSCGRWSLRRPPRSTTSPNATKAARPSSGAATGSWRVASP
jgi:hypothetical protein